MNVTVAPELEKFVAAQVEGGRYKSASEVVSAALEILQEREPAQADAIEPLHARVDDALLALTKGEGAEGEAFVENAEGELEESQEDERPVGR